MLRKISRTLRAPLASTFVSALTPPGRFSTDRCHGVNWCSPSICAYACRSPWCRAAEYAALSGGGSGRPATRLRPSASPAVTYTLTTGTPERRMCSLSGFMKYRSSSGWAMTWSRVARSAPAAEENGSAAPGLVVLRAGAAGAADAPARCCTGGGGSGDGRHRGQCLPACRARGQSPSTVQLGDPVTCAARNLRLLPRDKGRLMIFKGCPIAGEASITLRTRRTGASQATGGPPRYVPDLV